MSDEIPESPPPDENKEDKAAMPVRPDAVRERLDDTRRSITHHFTIHSGEGNEIEVNDGYITVGLYHDGRPGEVFIKMAKQGSTISGLMNSVAILTSIALQHGVPIQSISKKLELVRFEPSGRTNNPNIRFAKSPVDYMFRWLDQQFNPGEANGHQPIEPPEH